jgi:hemoglobin
MSDAWQPVKNQFQKTGHGPLQSIFILLNRYLKYLITLLFLGEVMTPAERREQIVADITARTGITEAMIDRLVRSFYERVRADEMLGPIFDARIKDWEPHLQQMCAFWSSVALMSGRYHGAPMPKHLPLPIDAAHFDRWLALFEATAAEVCPSEAAAHFVERAHRIAASLELGVAGANGVLLGLGERFRRQEEVAR